MAYPWLSVHPRTVFRLRPAFAALLFAVFAVLVPRAASAVQSAELYRTQAYFYGRFEARVQYAPGDGVVSSFFLWKDGSSSTTSWNELDFEKIEAGCRLQTNIWTGTGTQSKEIDTPSFSICTGYHTYAFEWTPDYIAWLIDGAQIRKVTGASVTEYTKNASQGMAIHFNIWQGDSSFGGTLNSSILPVHQYIGWVQYSSYANGAFQLQWREDFNASTIPSGWAVGNWTAPLNHSTHNPANVSYVNGVAVLSMTADNATGYSGTPPADGSGTGGTSGTAGAAGTAGATGTGGAAGRGGATGTGGGAAGSGAAGRGGAGGTAGSAGRGGTGGSASPGSGGTSSTGNGGTGVAGTSGSGAGGMAAGVAGNGAGGLPTGAAGSGTGGPSGNGGALGTGGALATGGTSATGAGGTAVTGTGGDSSGAAGQTTGSGTGCACRAAADGRTGSSIALMLIAACVLRRRRRS